MKKQERKKMNNKGFSLVELIVVVAIMAVLAVVVAPQYTRYVEKTRVQKDESAAAEFEHAVEIAITEEAIYTGLTFTDNKCTVTAPDNAEFTGGSADLVKELVATFPEYIDFTSSMHKDGSYTVTIDCTDGNIKVTGEWDSPATP